MNSQTPRTDAVSQVALQMGRGPNRIEELMVPVAFARTLELELNEAKEQNQKLLADCEKLPELIYIDYGNRAIWRTLYGVFEHQVTWETEGLQVCHEAEKLLTAKEKVEYVSILNDLHPSTALYSEGNLTDDESLSEDVFELTHATYEQRLEALCRVWFPERFNK